MALIAWKPRAIPFLTISMPVRAGTHIVLCHSYLAIINPHPLSRVMTSIFSVQQPQCLRLRATRH